MPTPCCGRVFAKNWEILQGNPYSVLLHRAGVVSSHALWYSMVNRNKGGGAMGRTYCGKNCQECGDRADTGCPGCLEQASRECKLAQCCREKGHESCQSCTFHTQCSVYWGKDTAPKFRLAQKKSVLEYQQEMKRKGTYMAKWLWMLFWIFIPSAIGGVIAYLFPAWQMFGLLLAVACTLVYGVLLLKLADEEEKYRTAGVLNLAVALFNVGAIFAQRGGGGVLMSGMVAVLAMPGYYYEFNAHADVLEGADNELSEKWRKLWKWKLNATIAMVLGLILTLILIGVLLVLVAAIAMVVISVTHLVYLYRTAKTFQGFSSS